ncbi:SWIM zinc finger family protein [Streptomyces spirodelae]|uniref:SWIM zinc finger family protein n=1 Tax=Streptomyces spirodelae TaxID=2812904 RepID=A0ABS3WY85_9ACTN|nr:SWIM zinc finger family protein [Streptomyces spirodelae]MBO8188034.1 SWIM zinc finger family protein [Streptomyces spirodelae]
MTGRGRTWTRAPGSTGGSLGGAWLRAMEGTARDTARLERGRAYAESDPGASGGELGTSWGVAAVRVGPGRVTAYVHGSRARPYRAEWRLPVLSQEEWDTFLSAVAARPTAAAALLDGDIPHSVVALAGSAGVRLLPEADELVPVCSCPDQGHPCKHAAALGYETARLLDADPWALLLMRGRAAEELREDIARRSTRREAVQQHASPGSRSGGDGGEGGALSLPAQRQSSSTLPAGQVFADTVRPPLPEPLPLPEAAGEPGPFPELPGAPSADALAFLATDAANRARRALAAASATADGDGDPLAELSLWHDTIRLAATHPQLTGRRTLSSLFAALARSAGRDALELARAAAAWRQGGAAGLAVLEGAWDPPAGDFDRGRSSLAALGIAMTIHRNRLTHATRPLQLRYGRDGRWYPYRAAPDGPASSDSEVLDWWPEGRAAPDPVQALTGLREL